MAVETMHLQEPAIIHRDIKVLARLAGPFSSMIILPPTRPSPHTTQTTQRFEDMIVLTQLPIS